MTATVAPNRSAPSVRALSTAGTALLLAGPLLEMTSELIAPREPAGLSQAGDVRFLLEHASRLTASWVVGSFAAAALAAAYVVVAQHLLGRGRIVGAVAATLGVLGAVGLGGHMAVSLASLDVASEDRTLSAAVHAMESGRAAFATFPSVVFGLNLAIILISIAAARAGMAPRWVIALGVLAFLGDFSPTNYNTVIHAAFAALVFGFIARGLRRPVVTENHAKRCQSRALPPRRALGRAAACERRPGTSPRDSQFAPAAAMTTLAVTRTDVTEIGVP